VGSKNIMLDNPNFTFHNKISLLRAEMHFSTFSKNLRRFFLEVGRKNIILDNSNFTFHNKISLLRAKRHFSTFSGNPPENLQTLTFNILVYIKRCQTYQ